MNDITTFWFLTSQVEEAERKKKEAESLLKDVYPELIRLCPHPEAIDWNFGHRGCGDFRVCAVCGIEDRESYGGTPGDEYNYGTAGRPDPEFWKNSVVRRASSEQEFGSYRRQHGWHVKNGSADHWYRR